VLDFPEIVNYHMIMLTLGIDYQIYFCIYILKHIQRSIFTATRQGRLIMFLNDRQQMGEAVIQFKSKDYLDEMTKLKESYRKIVRKEIKIQLN
jgi:hypothetical protein